MAGDFYTTLGLRHDASQEDVLRAYRAAVRSCHPDLYPGNDEARRRFHQVQQAFEVLGDPDRRRAYHRATVTFDTTRVSGVRPWPAAAKDRPYHALTRHAAVQVAEPALGLAVTASVGASLQCLALCAAFFHPGPQSSVVILLGMLSCALGLLVIVGAIQMRKLAHYHVAALAALAAALSCLSPWFLPAVPFGLWSLFVLRNPQVNDAFWS